MPGSHDATVYGVTRSSPKDYYSHHATLISSAITVADALVVVEYAIFLDHRATAGWQVDDYLGRLEAARAPARPTEGSAE